MYAKVYRSMWEGTLAGSGVTWAVFVFLLAHCDAEGFVDIHPKVISALTGFPEDAVWKALGELEAADFKSRSEAQQGARLERLDAHRDWGWQIVNYVHYRTLADADVVRQQNRDRQRKRRGVACNAPSRSVTLRHAPSRQEEVEVEAEAKKKQNSSPDGERLTGFETFWESYPTKVGKKPSLKAWKARSLEGKAPEIQAGLERWKKSERWLTGYVCDPLVFLNQERWKETPPGPRAAPGKPPVPETEAFTCHRCMKPHTRPRGSMQSLCRACKEAA